MDVGRPIRAVVPTLDGPVLEVLARTTRWLTGPEVHRLAAVGSPNGVRLVLARLVKQGLVVADEHPAAVLYQANREHLAWPAVETLAGIRARLIEGIRGELDSWGSPALHASLFGSVARGDGDAESDIDVLVVRPDDADEDQPPWADQVDRLRAQVWAWTGNQCQVFQLEHARLTEHVRAKDPLVGDLLRDSVRLTGPDLRAFVGGLASPGGTL